MDIKRIKPYLFLFLLLPLLGCPWKDYCLDDVAGSEHVDGLMVLSPLQDTFKLGDVVIFEIIIPDSFYFGDNKISLIGETSDEKPMIRVSQGLFDDAYNNFFSNELQILHGERANEESVFYLHFCFDDNMYKLRIKVTFISTRNYRFLGRDRIVFGSKKNCNFYSITTNVKGTTGDWLEFVVIE